MDLHTTSSSFRRFPTSFGERGDTLIEALIAILLATILGVGFGYMASRAQQAQRFTLTQGIALEDMRQQLTQTGLDTICGGSSLTSIVLGTGNTAQSITPQVDSSVSCATQNVVVSLADGTAPKTLVIRGGAKISATSIDLLGGSVVLQSGITP